MGHFNDTHYCERCDVFTNDIQRVGDKWVCSSCLKEPEPPKNEMG